MVDDKRIEVRRDMKNIQAEMNTLDGHVDSVELRGEGGNEKAIDGLEVVNQAVNLLLVNIVACDIFDKADLEVYIGNLP